MALVAKMLANSVINTGGRRWEACYEDDDGAKPVAEVYENYTYGVPKWLRDAEFVRSVSGQTSESIKLGCVRTDDPDDPNAEWFEASPNGELSITMQNPGGFGYIKPGREYRITIEEIQPQKRRQTKVFVNGVEVQTNDREWTYERICGEAGKNTAGQPTTIWDMQDGRGGTLLPGDTVDVAPGMRFTCMITNNA